MRLIAVDAPHFHCGIVVHDGMIIKAAPILRWAIGWQLKRFEDYCERKNWKTFLIQS